MTDFHAAPSAWSRKQLKWAVTFQRGHDLPDESRVEGPVPVYAGGGITGWHNEACAKPPGIVTGRYGTIGEFHLVSTPYWPLNTALYSIDFHDNCPEYLRYLLEFLAPLFHVHAGKSAVPGVDRNDIHTISVALPEREQQRQIATFLETETRRIDGLLTAKQRVLDLLAEKRKAIIATAVTRGLDPKVKLRDSCVPWLGEIPAHWEIVPFRWYFRVGSGEFIATDEVASEPDGARSTPVIGGNGVAGYASLGNTAGLSIAVGRVGAQCGNVHVINGQAWVTDNALLVRDVRQYAEEYLALVLRLRDLNSIANKTAQPLITGSMVTELRGPLPPIAEQRAIVDHIARETAKLDAVRDATERTIALLKERRSALIAAAVTGQLDAGAAA